MSSDVTNNVVYCYLLTVNSKLAKEFKKKVSLSVPLLPTTTTSSEQPSLHEIVVHYFKKTSSNCDNVESIEQEGQQQMEAAADVNNKGGTKEIHSNSDNTEITMPPHETRNKVFIRNVDKETTFEDFEPHVVQFGEVSDFHNSGKGHAFITFNASISAKKCLVGLNKTEIAGKIVEVNFARDDSTDNNANQDGCTLFVHGVKQETEEEDLKSAFAKFGTIKDIFNPGKNFAFVKFSTPAEASLAAKEMNGTDLCGSIISVNVSKPKQKSQKSEIKRNSDNKSIKRKKNMKETFRLFINNVSEKTTQDELKTAFSVHGDVLDSYNPGKGFAFVTFSQEENAASAIKAFNGKEVCGNIVECNIARYKKRKLK